MAYATTRTGVSRGGLYGIVLGFGPWLRTRLPPGRLALRAS